MTAFPRATRSLLRPALFLVAAMTLAACAGGSGAGATPGEPSAPAASDGPPSGSVDPGAGGGAPGDPGTGTGVAPPGGPGPIDPGAGQAQLVRPQPGRMDPHPVVATALQASVDGRRVLVKVSWYGGVEPCSVLDSVRVERSGRDIAITPIEGSSDRTAVCPEIALLKATIVDLGDLEPGTWRISSPGSDAPPIELTIA
jgi:hypothetical protein